MSEFRLGDLVSLMKSSTFKDQQSVKYGEIIEFTNLDYWVKINWGKNNMCNDSIFPEDNYPIEDLVLIKRLEDRE